MTQVEDGIDKWGHSVSHSEKGRMVARGPGSSWTGLLMRPAEEVRERGLALLGYAVERS